jgi:hypothetical protein
MEISMATISDGELFLKIDGASDDRLRGGLEALRASLEASGVSVADALLALRQQETSWEPTNPFEAKIFLRHIKAMELGFRAIFDGSETPRGTLIDFGLHSEREEDHDEPPAAPDPGQLSVIL